jgi:hypothetical protein
MSTEHISALQRARDSIKDHRVYYVCNALPNTKAGRHIEEAITESLGGYASVRDWLAGEHGIQLDLDQARVYRLAWIDWMIEGWRAQK